MAETKEFDEKFALSECGEIRGMVGRYIDIVTATERLALGGAAAFAAFSISGITPEIERLRIVISFVPFLILSLAGLRCLTFYLVLRASVSYIERVENTLLSNPELGFQRVSRQVSVPLNRAIEGTSGGFWFLAIGAAFLFWLIVNDLT